MYDNYTSFLEKIDREKVVFLECGVGYNTPTIIRFPFERMTLKNPNATIVRLNLDYPRPTRENEDKTIGFDENIEDILDYWLSRI